MFNGAMVAMANMDTVERSQRSGTMGINRRWDENLLRV